MTYPHPKQPAAMDTAERRPLIAGIAREIVDKLRTHPSRPVSLLGGKYNIHRPAGYTDEGWKAALTDARRLGFL